MFEQHFVRHSVRQRRSMGQCGDAVAIAVGIGGIMRPKSKSDLPLGCECGRFTVTLVLSYNASSFFSPR